MQLFRDYYLYNHKKFLNLVKTEMMRDLRDILQNSSPWVAQSYFKNHSRSQYLGNNKILCEILGDKKFFALADDVGFSSHMIMDGYWEFWLTKYFSDVIMPGDTVIDIGANLGYYSIIAADLVAERGRVYSVEPNPLVAALLSNSVSVNGYAQRVQVLNFALSFNEEEKRLPFFVPNQEPKNGRFVAEGENHEYLKQFGVIFDVNVGSLSPEQFDRVDFIKIDVEGAELAVLNHLKPIIHQFRPKIVCEVNFARGYGYDDVAGVLDGGEELKFLDFDSVVKPLTKQMAETQRVGDDWLICVS
jgi:FkbM family methyltransferase